MMIIQYFCTLLAWMEKEMNEMLNVCATTRHTLIIHSLSTFFYAFSLLLVLHTSSRNKLFHYRRIVEYVEG